MQKQQSSTGANLNTQKDHQPYASLLAFAADEAKMQKVDRAPTVELNGLHGEEATRLGKPGASPTDAGFDKLLAAMKKYSAK